MLVNWPWYVAYGGGAAFLAELLTAVRSQIGFNIPVVLCLLDKLRPQVSVLPLAVSRSLPLLLERLSPRAVADEVVPLKE